MDYLTNKVKNILSKLKNKKIFLASLSNLGLILVNLGIFGNLEYDKFMTIVTLVASTLVFLGIFETEDTAKW